MHGDGVMQSGPETFEVRQCLEKKVVRIGFCYCTALAFVLTVDALFQGSFDNGMYKARTGPLFNTSWVELLPAERADASHVERAS